MAKGFKAGAGGGTALNFKVVGNPQPESPKENTIWVNTDVPITGWYFAATRPENMAEGEVWFPTGKSSTVAFNALKKNGIQVCPLSAKQMVSGSLVDVEAKSYQGGAWVDWNRYIFKDGVLSEITGFTSVNGTVAITNTIDFVTNSNAYAHWYSNERIDVTNIDKINVTISDDGSRSYAQGNSPLVGVSKSIPTNSSGTIGGLAAHTTFINSEGPIPSGVYEVNVSEIEGSVYLVFSCIGTQLHTNGLHIDAIEFV